VRSRAVLAGILVASLAAPAVAFAAGGSTTAVLPQSGSNPLSPGIPQAPLTTTTSTPVIVNTSTTPGSSGVSGSGAIIIAIGAIAVLAGISFFIWRDARRRAPVRHRAAAATAGAGERSGAKQKAKPRKLSPAERRRRKRGRAR
jgi:hypothetical protein